jgi:hypothetical protein
MAYLFDSTEKTCIPLLPHHTFGRLGGRVDTQIDKPYISKLHSAIEWTGRLWRIRNLGINGTWVNGVVLEQGKNHELKVGDMIHFAKKTDAGYEVMDLAPPADMLWPLSSQEPATSDLNPPSPARRVQPIYLSRYHLLPDAQEPELALYYDDQDQQWYSEQVTSQQEAYRCALRSGETIAIGATQWQFLQAMIYSPTEAYATLAPKLSDFDFVFNLSLDEETTQLELIHPLQTVDLLVRSHHCLLLQLARYRAADAARGLDEKSQGWIYTERLGSDLGLDSTHINIHIFRLRKQIADAMPNNPGQQILLERRGGKIRFGCSRFRVYKGAKLMDCAPLPALATDLSRS